LSAALSLGIR
jgi:hypothetical protein